MQAKVCKFGGSSLADASQIAKVARIVRSDPDRRYVVPSAPGKRTKDDRKITDLLYLCHEAAAQQVAFDEAWELVASRYRQIVADLGLTLDIDAKLDEVHGNIAAPGSTADYAASRGEYLNGVIIAELLGYTFVDAAQIIFFNDRGRLDEQRTYEVMGKRLAEAGRAVVPGFYGSTPDGQVKTFSRGGSDISGAIVARAVGASVYENWTDVSGLLMADPRIVEIPRAIETITYRELRELSYSGATVLHDEAVFPVRAAGIPVNIRNTNIPDDPGTTIIKGDDTSKVVSGAITGIAGRKDFTIIALEKALMNAELGYGRKLLEVFEDHGVNFEHMPSGIDTMSVIVADGEVKGRLDKLIEEIDQECHPDSIEVDNELAVIATVGRGMMHTPGMAAKLFGALAGAGVNIRMIDQGSSELNIIVGVENEDFERTVRTIYNDFVLRS